MFFILLFFIDIKYYILPDLLTLSLLWIGIIFNYYTTFITLEESITGAIIGYLMLWLIFWIYKFLTNKEGLGYGDFKLLAAIGAWFGNQILLYIIFTSSILGIIIFILSFNKKQNDIIPFGSIMILSTMICILTKDYIYHIYNHIITH